MTASTDDRGKQLYPEYLLPIAGEAARYDRFSVLREAFLLAYCYNTARAYWGDLESIYLWAAHHGHSQFDLTEAQIRQYAGLLRRRKYSENTIRRHCQTWRRFVSFAQSEDVELPSARSDQT